MSNDNKSKLKTNLLERFWEHRTPTIVLLLISFLTLWSIAIISIERSIIAQTEIRSVIVHILDHEKGD